MVTVLRIGTSGAGDMVQMGNSGRGRAVGGRYRETFSVFLGMIIL